MNRTTGLYETSSLSGESVRAFIPHALPPAAPALDLGFLAPLNAQAEGALAHLTAMINAAGASSLPGIVYAALRAEALLTSQIEGIEASMVDVLDAEAGRAVANAADVEEVQNYLRAAEHVRKELAAQTGLPLSVRLLCDGHRLLMNGARGVGKQGGQVRRSQNWLGGARPAVAAFVPPPPGRVLGLLSDLEQFIHEREPRLPPLVRIALIHVQFETIHPFLDGNGRLGRLLNAVLMEEWGLLPGPAVYLSVCLKNHQDDYYRRLARVRTHGDWEGWIAFFLRGVADAAAAATELIAASCALHANNVAHAGESEGVGSPAHRLARILPVLPRFTKETATHALGGAVDVAVEAIERLTTLGIVSAVGPEAGYFGYTRYVDLLSAI